MRNRHRRHAEPSGKPQNPPAPEAQGDGEPAAAGMDDLPQAGASEGTPRRSEEPDNPGPGAPRAQATADDAAQQLEEQRDRYLRLAAEYDNFRKRTAKERVESGSRAQAEIVSRILESLDDLARFAHVDPAVTDAQTLHKGIEMVEQKMMKALGLAGLELINPLDQTFDPTLHEAVTTEAALSPEDDHTVARVFQPGYRFNGQLLRPARVVVKQWTG